MTDRQRRELCLKKKNPTLTLANLATWLKEKHKIDVGIPTISNTLKRSNELLGNDQINLDSKRYKTGHHPDVDRILYKWMTVHENKISMNGTILREKATDIFKELHPGEVIDFQFSDGWLTGFKKRFGIQEYHTVGESGSVDQESLESEIPKLREALDRYEWKDIYNMDETGLFYRMQPDSVSATKQLEGRKKDKEKMTIALCTNGDGSDMLPLLVIGKYENPRCFKNLCRKNLECTYRWSNKAWMTFSIFNEWLLWFDKRLDRKVLLILDNCAAHGSSKLLPRLKNTEILHLPPNMTSKLQPLDAGIIRSFKARYRLHLVRRILENIEKGLSKPADIDLLTGIRIAVKAWNEVTTLTITNCFRHCQIRSDMDSEQPIAREEQDVLGQLNACIHQLPYENPMSIDNLLDNPEEQVVTSEPSLSEFVEQEKHTGHDDEEEAEAEIELKSNLTAAQVFGCDGRSGIVLHATGYRHTKANRAR